jgi:GT2 family glycosyltransferase
MSRSTTTVIVVSYRPGAWLGACLASVRDQADDVILVDNGSADALAGEIGDRAGVRVHRLARNAGFVGGVNAALALVATDTVALLNDDAEAGPGWLASAAEVLDDPSVAAVGPKVVLAGRYAGLRLDTGPMWVGDDPRPFGTRITDATVDGRDVLGALVGGLYPFEEDDSGRWRWTNGYDPIYAPLPAAGDGASPPRPGDRGEIRINGRAVVPEWSGDVVNNAGSFLDLVGHSGDVGFETADDGRFDQQVERFGVTGAAMVARTATFGRLGGMAPGFFAYYEDVDWSWRARLAGYRLVYDPAGVVRHVRSATTDGLGRDFAQQLARRNRLLCLVRNAPLPVVVDQLARSRTDPDRRGTERPLLPRLPAALAWRMRTPGRTNVTRREVFRTWAGRDTQWGLAIHQAGSPGGDAR